MEQEKNKLSSMMIIVGIFFGFGFGFTVGFDKPTINITSIKDGQELHSIVPIDAIYTKGELVGVWINGTYMNGSEVLPFYWNNMLYPVGEYDIAVGVYRNDKWEYDNVTVIIPVNFTVPANYTFSEDFVVHTGQTVYMNYNFDISGIEVKNGWNSVNEREYFAINNFGTLHINASIKCEDFLGEGNSKTYWYNGEIKITKKHYQYYTVYPDNFIRFDDNSELYLQNNNIKYYDEYEEYQLLYTNNNTIVIFYENAIYYSL